MNQNSPDVPTLVRRGHAYSRRGEYARAAEMFSGPIDLDPADAAQADDAATAAPYTDALRTNPRPARAYLYRGLSLETLGRPDEAMADLSTALRLQANNPEAFWHRARLWAEKGEHQKAIAD